MLLQFGQYVADFSPLRHRLGLRVFANGGLMMLAYGLKHLKHFRVLLFGQKIYLDGRPTGDSQRRLETRALAPDDDTW
jgi:hypothetical protein